MKKLVVISTGGTIACTTGAAGLVPTLSARDILSRVPRARVFSLDTRTLFSLDSSNIQPEEWREIAREVYACLADYDGVVVLHGTDTMAYTASMLSFMLRGVNKPVIITGSQLPIDHPHTDAKRNLRHALLAASSPLRGVHVVFDGRIMRGCRVAKVRTTSRDAFESINAAPVGEVRHGRVRLSPEAQTASPGPFALDDALDTRVFLLKLIPGTHPEIFERLGEMGFRGVVIEGFGLGGIHCLRRNLLDGITALLAQGVAVLLTTQCRYEPSDLTVYEPGRLALDSGILQGFDMTSECAVTKLMWVLGHTSDLAEVRHRMYTSFCGEVTLPEVIPAIS